MFNADLLQLVQNVGKQTDVFTLKDTILNSITIALSFDGFIQKLQYLEIVNVILLTQVLYHVYMWMTTIGTDTAQGLVTT